MEWTVLEIKKRALVLVLLAVEIHHSKVGKVWCSHQHELLLALPSTLTTSSVSQSRNELRLNAPSFWPSWLNLEAYSSLLEHQFCSVTQSFPTLCDPMDCSMPGLPIYHQHLELAQIYVHWVGDAIQPSHPLSSPSPAFNFSQHQGLFQSVSSSHQVAKVLEFQLHH